MRSSSRAGMPGSVVGAPTPPTNSADEDRAARHRADRAAFTIGCGVAALASARLCTQLVLDLPFDPHTGTVLLIGLAAVAWPSVTTLKTPFGELSKERDRAIQEIGKAKQEALIELESEAPLPTVDQSQPRVPVSPSGVAVGPLPPAGLPRIAKVEAGLLPSVHEKDTQAGRFGDRAEANDKKLLATVRRAGSGWYDIELRVTSSKPGEPLAGPVKFFLHESFRPSEILVFPRRGQAQLRLNAFGSFTVGVICYDGTTLSLDLADETQVAQPDEVFRDL
jgi:hypothetical protein